MARFGILIPLSTVGLVLALKAIAVIRTFPTLKERPIRDDAA